MIPRLAERIDYAIAEIDLGQYGSARASLVELLIDLKAGAEVAGSADWLRRTSDSPGFWVLCKHCRKPKTNCDCAGQFEPLGS